MKRSLRRNPLPPPEIIGLDPRGSIGAAYETIRLARPSLERLVWAFAALGDEMAREVERRGWLTTDLADLGLAWAGRWAQGDPEASSNELLHVLQPLEGASNELAPGNLGFNREPVPERAEAYVLVIAARTLGAAFRGSLGQRDQWKPPFLLVGLSEARDFFRLLGEDRNAARQRVLGKIASVMEAP